MDTEEPIEIIFDRIQTVQELGIAGNSPFYDRHIIDMCVARILETQEYTHDYHMRKIISANKLTWVNLKSHF